jgi:hypothetical protein
MAATSAEQRPVVEPTHHVVVLVMSALVGMVL